MLPAIGRRHQQAEKESGEEATEMSGHADARSDNVEGQLQEHDDEDVSQTLSGQRSVAMTEEKTDPCADDAHNATGGTDELHRFEQSQFR